jgi:hypothetical protein
MLNALKPVSDLQRVQRFDDYDLTANRAGMLSIRQRWRFVGTRLAEHALMAVTVIFFFALVIDTLSLLQASDAIAIAVILVLLITLLSFLLSVLPTFQKSVLSIKGILRKDFAIPLDSVPFEEIAIGPERFFVRFELFDVLEEDAIYQAYYLKRSQRSGGNLLLSVEMIEAASDRSDE